MRKKIESYGLDIHGEVIIEEYRDKISVFRKIEKIAVAELNKALEANNISIGILESRIKAEESLAGKLLLKGAKYNDLYDLTDIVGIRVVTFYTDDVDKVSGIVDKIFKVDWTTSVDKRKMHELNSFGYNSLHYICRIPKKLYSDPGCPEFNEIRFELQMRTALQHVWATMYHDTGYKSGSGVEVPREYLRNLNRLAGMLELADEQFSQIRTNINDYRRKVQSLVSSGRFDDVTLDGDSYRSYLTLKPFDKLLKKIAAINQAEILEASYVPYFPILSKFSFTTIGDVDRFIKEYSDDAYLLAVHQLGSTDLDIISSTIAIQNLCIVRILKNGGGVDVLKRFFDVINGESYYNMDRAERLFETAMQLPFMIKE